MLVENHSQTGGTGQRPRNGTRPRARAPRPVDRVRRGSPPLWTATSTRPAAVQPLLRPSQCGLSGPWRPPRPRGSA